MTEFEFTMMLILNVYKSLSQEKVLAASSTDQRQTMTSYRHIFFDVDCANGHSH
jgi:hypothetical protein